MTQQQLPEWMSGADRLEAEDAIRMALEQFPDLRYIGFTRKPDEPPLVHGLPGIATAINYLRQCQKTRACRFNSYGLKHAAERWGQKYRLSTYVSNGSLIAAAVYLGFRVKRDGGHSRIPETMRSPNALINVSSGSTRRLQALIDTAPHWSHYINQ